MVSTWSLDLETPILCYWLNPISLLPEKPPIQHPWCLDSTTSERVSQGRLLLQLLNQLRPPPPLSFANLRLSYLLYSTKEDVLMIPPGLLSQMPLSAWVRHHREQRITYPQLHLKRPPPPNEATSVRMELEYTIVMISELFQKKNCWFL